MRARSRPRIEQLTTFDAHRNTGNREDQSQAIPRDSSGRAAVGRDQEDQPERREEETNDAQRIDAV